MHMRQLIDLVESKNNIRDLSSITDDELEQAIDGTTNLDMVRSIAQDNLTPEGLVDVEDFASWFSQAIEGYINAEPETDEWLEADTVNREWGESIADGINQILTGQS